MTDHSIAAKSSATIWGATPDDWRLFSEQLGLTSDLLPVVSVPGAKISSGSTMKDLGKTPSLYNKDGEVVGIGKWTSRQSTTEDVAKWSQDDHYGICLQTRTVRAIDIDIPDTSISNRIRDFVQEFLNIPLPLRYRLNSGKCLLAFRLPGEMPKRVLKVDGGIIEFLATGQQFIAAGTHPSGVRYVWRPFEDFPEIDISIFENLWYALELEFGIAPSNVGALRKRAENEQEPVTDKVAQFLEAGGHVLEYGPEGQAHIACPFAGEHTTDSAVSATSYFPAGSRGYERGHFICRHAHCVGRTDTDFLDAFGYRMAGFEVIEAQPGEQEKERVVLNPGAHSDIADKIAQARFTNEDGQPTLLRLNGDWYCYGAEGCYRDASNERVRGVIRSYLDQALKFDPFKPKQGTTPFYPTIPQISGVAEALANILYRESVMAPAWLSGQSEWEPLDVVALANGLFHIPTRELMAHTAQFFTFNALPYAWEETGAPVEWLKFLGQLWPDDQQSRDTLQEMFGYLLTSDTTQQKMFLIKGPKRSGKGTIWAVLKELLGDDNVCGPSLSAIATQFGLQGLIGKLLACIPDARVSGRADKQAIVEKLLAISGQDTISIPRKHLTDWTGRMGVRFVMLTNEVPQLGDAAGALASRFIVLSMQRSFYGQEDHGLQARLLKELPQIFKWALDGRDRLNARGYFIQPDSSGEIIEELENLNSPLQQFVSDQCELGTGYEIGKDELYGVYEAWCRNEGRDHPSTKAIFSRDLLSAFHGRVVAARAGGKGEQVRVFKGLRIRDGDLANFDDIA